MYVPAVLVPGTNVPKLPPPKTLGVADHEPPDEGLLNKELKRLTLVEFEHTVIAPLVPELGSGLTVIVIVMGVPAQPFAVGVTV